MTSRLLIFIGLLVIAGRSNAQNGYGYGTNPAILWQKSLGGTEQDIANNILLTQDGGMIVVGTSQSNDGDVTGHHGAITSTDGWVVKLNGAGSIEWQRSLGGSNDDAINSVIATSDGGYLCMGFTNSSDGDVTVNKGNADCWLLKLKANGNIAWSKTYGGVFDERAKSGILASDGNYVIIGSTSSVDGDVHNPDPANTDFNGWLIKINNDGDLIWENSIDQSAPFNHTWNEGIDVVETDDHQLIACISGMSRHDTAFAYYNPEVDTWDTIRYNNLVFNPGILYHADLATGQATYFTETRGESARYQFALKKKGNHLYMAYMDEQSYYYECYSDPSYIPFYQPVAGLTVSDLDLTTGSFSNTFLETQFNSCPDRENGGSFPRYTISPFSGLDFISGDTWITAGRQNYSSRGGDFYNIGQLQGANFYRWYGGSGINGLNGIKVFPNGTDFIVVGYNGSADAGAAVHGADSGSYGDFKKDFWVMKFSLNANKITGKVFLDVNNNNIADQDEPAFTRAMVNNTKGNMIKTSGIDDNGHYEFLTDTGTYVTKLNLYNDTYYAATPVAHTSTFAQNNNIDTVDFAVHRLVDIRDYSVTLTCPQRARPGTTILYHINYTNNGTDTFSQKQVRFVKDSRLVFTSQVGGTVNADSLVWTIDRVLPGASGELNVWLTVPVLPFVNFNDTLSSSVLIDSSGDHYPADNHAFLKQVVSGSFDPNDKQEAHAGYYTLQNINGANYLTYSIRFQNTGNDTAFNIIVRDTLDNRLDGTGIEMISASHPYKLTMLQEKYVTWQFENVQLVDSVHNEPESNGYINYRVKLKNGLLDGDEIPNAAAIYFDYNPPVQTNTAVTKIIMEAAVWTGAVSDVWEDGNNWSTGEVPGKDTKVIIPQSQPRYPVVKSDPLVYSLQIAKSATISISSGHHLTIRGKSN